jgi:DNA invertase Pin-like site-specific DNA recombinase
MGALAQFERDCINQRATEGREAAKRRGQTGGRSTVDPTKIEAAKELVA